MNNTIQHLMVCATNKLIKGQRAFLPMTRDDDHDLQPTDFRQAVKIGFVPMTGGETNGGLYLTAIRDAQEKLLTYFLTGGKAEDLTEDDMHMFLNDDVIVVIGTTLYGEVKCAFAVDVYDRNNGGVFTFPHYQSEWAVRDVVDHVFLNAKLVDTLGG